MRGHLRGTLAPVCLLFADTRMLHDDLESGIAWLELLRTLLGPDILIDDVIRDQG